MKDPSAALRMTGVRLREILSSYLTIVILSAAKDLLPLPLLPFHLLGFVPIIAVTN